MWVYICSEHRHKIYNEYINPNKLSSRRKMCCQPRTMCMLDSCFTGGMILTYQYERMGLIWPISSSCAFLLWLFPFFSCLPLKMGRRNSCAAHYFTTSFATVLFLLKF